MKVGEKIRKLRLEKMMTQSELSGDQVTRNMLSLIEKDKAVPSLQTLNYIASRLNVSTAFLLADEREEKMLIKYSKISDIRLAFKNKSYKICMDMCKRLGRHHEIKDDEIKLIMAECALKIAEEEVYGDRIREACTYLDEAVAYASETTYNTKHIVTAAGLMFDYLGELSPSIVSENLDVDSVSLDSKRAFCTENEFLKYLVAQKDIGGEYTFEKEAYSLHVQAQRCVTRGELDKAYTLLGEVLKLNEWMAGVLLYNVFNDLEDCCRRMGNVKNAREYSEAKVAQLERILS